MSEITAPRLLANSVEDPQIGLCGWNGSQATYFENFGCIELQSTFYEPPSPETAAKWRRAAPATFRFTMKAWQLITHNATSPTYRRLKSALDTQDRTSVGSFRPTEQVWDAWQRTLVISRAVEASVIVFQCPKSFLPTGENLVNFSAFFRRIERGTFQIAWEPRGEAWTDDLVSELCTEHDLLHCVDPFQSTSVYGALTYWRLHGRGAYSYKYTDHDLELLKRLLLQQGQPAYCMFNNFSSKADALRFLHLLGPQRPGPWVAP